MLTILTGISAYYSNDHFYFVLQGGVKILVTGPWQNSNGNYQCLFDSFAVPASLIQTGVLRCYCPGKQINRRPGHNLLDGWRFIRKTKTPLFYCHNSKATKSNRYQCTDDYTLSHLENDSDVSAYSRAQRVCFLTRSKSNTGIDA